MSKNANSADVRCLTRAMWKAGKSLISAQFKTVKGQLISKCLLSVFTFFQNRNEKKSTSSRVNFVRSFFERKVALKKSFQICLTFRTF